ncbi:MAG: hypothetical protein ACM3US_07380 [Sphingomonadaceae bacterium]
MYAEDPFWSLVLFSIMSGALFSIAFFGVQELLAAARRRVARSRR